MQTGFQKQSNVVFIFKYDSVLVGITTCFPEVVRCWPCSTGCKESGLKLVMWGWPGCHDQLCHGMGWLTGWNVSGVQPIARVSDVLKWIVRVDWAGIDVPITKYYEYSTG